MLLLQNDLLVCVYKYKCLAWWDVGFNSWLYKNTDDRINSFQSKPKYVKILPQKHTLEAIK